MSSTIDMTGKTCLVTGAGAGIGLETARGLAQAGAHVILVARNREKGVPAKMDIVRSTRNVNVDLLTCDFSSQKQIRALAATVNERYPNLHVLVNNAGTFVDEFKTTPEHVEWQWGINHLGYFLLTHLLLDKLKASAPARIVVVSSNGHYSGDINMASFTKESGRYDGLAAYNQSKLGNVLFTHELSRRLMGTGVTVNALHPGVIATDIGNKNASGLASLVWRLLKPFMSDAVEGAKTPLYLATSPEVEGFSGLFFADMLPREPADKSKDEILAASVWQSSLALTGLEQHQIAQGRSKSHAFHTGMQQEITQQQVFRGPIEMH